MNWYSYIRNKEIYKLRVKKVQDTDRPDDNGSGGTWNEWRRFVFVELRRHDREIEALAKGHIGLQLRIEGTIIKVAIFSSAVAGISSVIALLVLQKILEAL